MPNRDGTGPEGKGPGTGRGLGRCGGGKGQVPILARPAGRGQGRRAMRSSNRQGRARNR